MYIETFLNFINIDGYMNDLDDMTKYIQMTYAGPDL